MTALLHSEWLKVRTTRAWWGYLIVIVLLSGVAAAGHVGSADEDTRNTLAHQEGLIDVVGVAVLIAILVGITIVTTEFRHGTVTPTFLTEPHRERVLAAKAITSASVAAGFVLLALVVVALVALTWFALTDVQTHLGESALWERVGQQLLSAVLWALLGVAIGTVVQGQVAALVGTLIWIFLGETLIPALFDLADVDGASAYLPFHALDAADGSGGEGLLSYPGGVAVSLAWIAVLGAAGTIRTRRRDIT